MPRTKPKNKITTRQEAEYAMARLCEIERMLAQLALTEAEEISQIRQKHVAYRGKWGVPGLETEMNLLVLELRDWAKAARGEWDQKTVVTPWGKLGFRVKKKSVELVKSIAKKTEQALTNIQSYMSDFVRRVPAIDKEKILAADREGRLDHGLLNSCGLRIAGGEEFWLETAASEDLKAAAERLKNA